MNKLYLRLAYWLLRRVVTKSIKGTWIEKCEETRPIFSLVAFDVIKGKVSPSRAAWSVVPEGSDGDIIFQNRSAELDYAISMQDVDNFEVEEFSWFHKPDKVW